MRTGTIALLIGILFFQQLAWLPSASWAVLTPVSLVLAWRWRGLRILCWGIAGFSWALLHAHAFHSPPFPRALEGKTLRVAGEVISIPEQLLGHTGIAPDSPPIAEQLDLRFNFRIDQLSPEHHSPTPPFRVSLSWYGAPVHLRAGEHWHLSVRLKQPSGFMNPGGFDYEGWLYQQNIVATGYIASNELNHRISGPLCHLCLHRWRQLLSDHLDHLLLEDDHRGLIKALVLGERSGISSEQWEVLARTGTNHLMAISGLHIGLMAGLAFWAGRWLWSRFRCLTLLLPAQKAASMAAMLTALLYAGLAGFSLPTIRALIMVWVAMLAQLRGRVIVPSQVLAMALLLALLIDPLAVLSAGFWLSFGAVALILYGMSCRVGEGGLWWRWGRVQWLVAAGLLPLTLLWFQRASLISPFANLVAVPVTGALVVPLSLAATVMSLLFPVPVNSGSVGGFLFYLVAQLLTGLWWFLQQLAAVPAAMWVQAIPSVWALLFSLAGVILLLAPAGIGRIPGIILMFPLVLVEPARPQYGEIWMTTLDVGQGLAVVVQTRGHLLLYDTGPGFSARFDAGRAVVVPYLRQQGISRIDTIIVSHANLDHSGGLDSVVRMLPADRVVSGEPLPQETNQGIAVSRCHEGESWQWDGVLFTILHPPAGYVTDNANDRSCVVQVRGEGGSLLLTGDIQRLAELRLSQRYGASLAASILVAPHHGSRTSSSHLFTRRVHPHHVVFSTGYANQFGHPHAEVQKHLQTVATVLSDTARHGAIRYEIHPQRGITGPQRFRLQGRRYWNRTNSQK